MKNNSLHNNWSWVKLGDVCKTTSGGTPSRKVKRYYDGDIAWLKSGELQNNTVFESEERITKEAIDSSSAKIFKKGTLLIALYGATVGRLAFLGIDAATNQAVAAIFPPDNLLNKYLYWYLFNYRKKLLKQRIGGAQPNISQGTLKNIPIPLPPLPEQHRIVEKIEELFTELDNGIENLKKAKAQIKTYRQAVLKAAFEGRLISEVRNQKSEVRSETAKVKSENGELPEGLSAEVSTKAGWEWVKLGDLLENIRYGTSKKCYYEPQDIPVLRIPNVIDGSIDLSDLKYSKFSEKEIHDLSLQSGDLLVIRSNGSLSIVGKSALVNEEVEGLLYAGYLIRLRLKTKIVNPSFLNYCFESRNLRNQIERKAKSTSGVNNINAKELQDLEIPLTELNTQTQIVEEIEKRFSVADKMEAAIDESLKKAEALRQSILKKAFEGKLVKDKTP